MALPVKLDPESGLLCMQMNLLSLLSQLIIMQKAQMPTGLCQRPKTGKERKAGILKCCIFLSLSGPVEEDQKGSIRRNKSAGTKASQGRTQKFCSLISFYSKGDAPALPAFCGSLLGKQSSPHPRLEGSGSSLQPRPHVIPTVSCSPAQDQESSVLLRVCYCVT